MKQLSIVITLISALVTGLVTGTAHAQTRTARPKLVVVLVVDQFRQEYLQRYAPFFGPGGFKLLQKNGAAFSNAHYGHATTYTGPGHALIGSGSYGHTSGIIGNRWFNRDTKQLESMFFDADAALLGTQAVPKDDDTSPRNFIGSNFADQLLLSNNFQSKAIGISLKDRAAIMLAGKLGKAYWFHEGVGGITSSTFYGATLPAWLQTFNARKIPDSYMGKTWNKSLPEAAYRLSRADNFAAEADVKGLGRTFPHTLTAEGGTPNADYYLAFTTTPFATDYEMMLAREAIENERLGQDEHPDLLGISITPTDIAGHSYGPDSQEVQDMVARLDGQLAEFFSYLNRRFKKGEVTVVLTADHGACPLPEYARTLGLDAGRIKSKAIGDAVEAALAARFGAPEGEAKWVLAVEDPGVYLNRDLIAARKLEAGEVQRVTGEAILTVPGMAAFYTRETLMRGQLPNQWAAMFEKSFHPSRSGDVLFQTKPFYFNGSYGNRDVGSTHGSVYAYDTHVPLIFFGAGVARGHRTQAADPADIAPTLAALLGLNPPSGSEGRVLSEALMASNQ